MAYNIDETKCIDINKGFRRVSNFPAFADEIFKNYEDAASYASRGLYGSTSYPGQLIRVVPESGDNPQIYVIDSQYRLVSTTESIVINDNLSLPFNYNSFDGTDALSLILPAGFIIDTITMKIIEGFINDDAIRVGMFDYDDPTDFVWVIGSGSGYRLNDVMDIYNPIFTIITDEDDTEFVFKYTKSLASKTALVIYLDRQDDSQEKGRGLLKIN